MHPPTAQSHCDNIHPDHSLPTASSSPAGRDGNGELNDVNLPLHYDELFRAFLAVDSPGADCAIVSNLETTATTSFDYACPWDGNLTFTDERVNLEQDGYHGQDALKLALTAHTPSGQEISNTLPLSHVMCADPVDASAVIHTPDHLSSRPMFTPPAWYHQHTTQFGVHTSRSQTNTIWSVPLLDPNEHVDAEMKRVSDIVTSKRNKSKRKRDNKRASSSLLPLQPVTATSNTAIPTRLDMTDNNTTSTTPSVPPQCANCHTTNAPTWRRSPIDNALVCNACGLYAKLHGTNRVLVVNEHGRVRTKRQAVDRGRRVLQLLGSVPGGTGRKVQGTGAGGTTCTASDSTVPASE